MITIHAWDKVSKSVQTLDASTLERGQIQGQGAQVLWIDLCQSTAEEETLVLQRLVPIHSLSLEDVTRPRREPDAAPHLPKVEEFPDYLFVIVNPLTDAYLKVVGKAAGPVAEMPARAITQLSAVLTDNVLITHHAEPLTCIDKVQDFLRRHEAQADRGPDYLFHLILDNLVDRFVPVLDYIDGSLDTLEVQVLGRPRPPLFQKLLRLKRQIILLRKTLIYEREVLVRLSRGDFALVDEREMVYYRNVYDHLVRFAELIEASREMVSDLLQSYLAATSNKLNEIMKVLTMISTVVLPMTLIAGVYGMNFDHMPEIKWTWGYPFALGLMLAVGAGSLVFFKLRKWL